MKLLLLCIPTYNRADSIATLLQKITSSKTLMRHMEIVIADNASSDSTQYVCNRYAEQYDNVVYIRNESNKGPHVNIEIALSNASGKYTWLFGDDDIPLIEHVERMIHRLASNDYDVYLLDRVIFYEDMSTILSKLPFKQLFKKNFSGSMAEAIGIASPFFLFGCISVLIMRREKLNLSCLKIFRSMQTLHTQIGLMVASYVGEDKIFIDSDNYIITNTSQRPDGYVNENKDSEKKTVSSPDTSSRNVNNKSSGINILDKLEYERKTLSGTSSGDALLRDLSFNVLRVYHYLIKHNLFEKNSLLSSYVCSYSNDIFLSTPLFHFYMAILHRRTLNTRQRKYVRLFYKKYMRGPIWIFYFAGCLVYLRAQRPKKLHKTALFGLASDVATIFTTLKAKIDNFKH